MSNPRLPHLAKSIIMSRNLRISPHTTNYQLQTTNYKEGGYFLVTVVIMMLFLTAIGLSIAALASAQYQHTKREVYVQNAHLLAEAGLEQSVQQLNTDDTFPGYTTDQEFFDNSTQGRGTFNTTITDNSDGNSKTIVAEGEVYRNSSDTTPYITRKVEAIVVGTNSSGYSVLTGPGGLILSGSANITNSHVYVSGTIDMNGNSQIGTYNNPLDVDVAHNACPKGSDPGPTYPEVCSDGSEPIDLEHSTDIYGTVCATGQTSTGPNNNIKPGNGGGGLQVGCSAPVNPLPTYDRQAHIDAVTTTDSGSSNSYVCNSYPFDRSWPANLQLNGDVSIAQSCDVTVNGDVYITGDLDIGGSASITVADSLGATRPVVIVDGTITVGGSADIIANSSGTGVEFISFKSAASCNPDCTSLSGNDLKNSEALETITVGGSVNLPGAIFRSYWSKAVLTGSGNLGAVTGQVVDLSGAGTVVFGTELSSGSKIWTITSYRPIYD